MVKLISEVTLQKNCTIAYVRHNWKPYVKNMLILPYRCFFSI